MAISRSLVLVSIQWAVTPKYDFLLADQQSAVVATNAAALILLEKKKKKVKPGETLVEFRRGSDLEIDRQMV